MYRGYRRRNYGNRSRGRVRRVGRKTNKTKKLVDGTPALSKVERMVASGASTASTVASLARSVGTIMSLINVEKKYIDTTFTNTVNNAGTVSCVSLIAQGDTDNNRNGNQILGQDVTLRHIMAINPSAATTFYRLLIFVDKECDGVAANVTDVLESATVYSPINKDFSKRFVILKSLIIPLSSNGQEVDSRQLYVKVPFHVFYDGSTAAIASCKENQIYILMLSDQATNAPAVSFTARFNYTDN